MKIEPTGHNVEPGVQYYYYFTVAVSGAESEPSNTASSPIDTVKPILSHNVISGALWQYGAGSGKRDR